MRLAELGAPNAVSCCPTDRAQDSVKALLAPITVALVCSLAGCLPTPGATCDGLNACAGIQGPYDRSCIDFCASTWAFPGRGSRRSGQRPRETGLRGGPSAPKLWLAARSTQRWVSADRHMRASNASATPNDGAVPPSRSFSAACPYSRDPRPPSPRCQRPRDSSAPSTRATRRCSRCRTFASVPSAAIASRASSSTSVAARRLRCPKVTASARRAFLSDVTRERPAATASCASSPSASRRTFPFSPALISLHASTPHRLITRCAGFP